MAQTVKLKRSATPSKVPGTSDLALGELAINTYDGKLYLKKNVSGTESIVEVTGGGASAAGSNGQIQFNASGSFGASANLHWDNTNGRLGIGILEPATTLHVAKSQDGITAFVVANYTVGYGASAGFQLVGGTLNSAFEANLYDSNGYPYVSFKTGSAVNGMYFDSNMTTFRDLAGSVNRLVVNSSGVGVGTGSFGASAENVVSIATGSAPTTAPADTIQIFSTDLSAGNTILSLCTEGSPVNSNTEATATHRIALRVNGTVYYLLANTSA